MKAGFQWIISPEKAVPELFQQQRTLTVQAVKDLADYYAPQIEAWMKQNAPWEDRTTLARTSLFAETEQLVDLVVITFGHGEAVFYSKYLEFYHQGRFAIVNPALDHFVPLIRASLQELMR